MARSVVELAAIAAQREQPEEALSAIVELRERLDELEEFQVENAREHGWSWSEIARPLGVTRQAVHYKYARRLDDARPDERKDRIVVSGDARRCVVRARREAAAFGHDSVGTDHLLLGLLAQGAIAKALEPLGLTLDRALFAATDLRGVRMSAQRVGRSGRPIPISRRAREVLEQSLREALQLGDGEIGAKHVLLALLRERGGRAAKVFERLGVTPAMIEEQLAD